MKKNIKKGNDYICDNWLSLIIKFLLFGGGFVLSTFGLALYQQPAIGTSQIDWVLYNSVALSIPFNVDGSMGGEEFRVAYKRALLILNLIFILTALFFSIKPSIDEYKKQKDMRVWFMFVWYIISDLIIAFTLPYLINEFFPIVSKWVQRDEHGNITSPVAIRNWLFVAGFCCFIIGIGMWVKSGWILGPFNNVCFQFLRLTKLNYAHGRLIIDSIILLIGFIFFIFIKGEGSKTDFLLTNFGLGTACYTFLVGPSVNQVLKLLNKTIIFDKLKINNLKEKKAEKNKNLNKELVQESLNNDVKP